MKIGLLVGSLRKDSWNKKVAEVVKDLFPSGVEAEFIDISNVPLYNEDLDGEKPLDAFVKVREDVKKYDGIIFFTPEYNRTMSPVPKNIIDIVSKDPSGNPWAKKPVAVFSASPGGFGAMSGNHALRQAFIFLDMMPMQQPEVYLSQVHNLFDEEGKMVDRTRDFLQNAANAFVDHVKLISK